MEIPNNIKKKIFRVLEVTKRPISFENLLPKLYRVVKEFIDIDYIYIKKVTLQAGKNNKEIEIELEFDLEGKIVGYKVSESNTNLS